VDRLLKVLIADDSEDDALLLVRQLKKGGLTCWFERVDTAEDMRVSLNRQHWDLVVTDHNMPAFSSSEALQLVKAIQPETPVIAVNRPEWIVRSTFFRLLPDAPSNSSRIFGLGLWRLAGISMRRLPDRYCPVSERGALSMSANVPCATTSPGPRKLPSCDRGLPASKRRSPVHGGASSPR